MLSELNPNQPLSIEGGLVTGAYSTDNHIAIFKGIPFASPPVGELRWKAPQPVVPWEGVRACTQFPPSAIQPPQVPFMMLTEEFFVDNGLGFSEDCLYLNVWAPVQSSKEKRPVVVFIHGGGYGSGGASCEIYDGEHIAHKDVIFVTIQYRVGILGFLATSALSQESDAGISGNYGTLDQVEALKWVNRNIQHFGGDPENVTIVGQSAGSSSVHMMTITPLAKGLFKNAVPLSWNYVHYDGPMALKSLNEVVLVNDALFQEHTLEEMRQMEPSQLLSIQFRPSPCIDGHVIPSDVTTFLATNTSNAANVLTGSVSGDVGLFPVLNIGNPLVPLLTLSKSDYEQAVQKVFGVHGDACLSAYPAIEEDALNVYTQLNLDAMRINQVCYAKLRSGHDSQVTYLFCFNHTYPGKSLHGAFHSADLPYWFGNFTALRKDYWQTEDFTLSEIMMSYLVNFAKTGNPNGNNLVQWTKYEGQMTDMYIDGAQLLMEAFAADKLAFWKNYYSDILND